MEQQGLFTSLQLKCCTSEPGHMGAQMADTRSPDRVLPGQLECSSWCSICCPNKAIHVAWLIEKQNYFVYGEKKKVWCFCTPIGIYFTMNKRLLLILVPGIILFLPWDRNTFKEWKYHNVLQNTSKLLWTASLGLHSILTAHFSCT